MSDDTEERQKALGDFLRERGPFPSRSGRPTPYEQLGDWEQLPNGIWRRQIVVSDDCIRVEYVTSSKAQADELSRVLQNIPDELEEARVSMNALAARLEAEVASGVQCRPEDVVSLIRAARDVEKLFERDARSAEAARQFENWEAKSASGRSRTKKDPVAAAKAEAKSGARLLWDERRAGLHPKLRTVEKFAIEVMRRWPVLESPKVIAQWSADWTKEAKAKRPPAS